MELIVSVAITAILMIGISAFFSDGFQNLFNSQNHLNRSQNGLVLSSILNKKFTHSNALQELGNPADLAVLKTDFEKELLPFTLITQKENRIALKDFLVFNGMEGGISTFTDINNIDQPAGITALNGHYFVAAPLEDAIYECNNLPGSCESKLDIKGLKLPVDLTTDGTRLFVTDAGNNRIVSINDPGGNNEVEEIASGFNFPTGIEFYPGEPAHLLVADTKHHLIKKINVENNSVEVMVGAGSHEACDQTALFCQLNYPMGLALGKEADQDVLFIADTGHGRVLKVSDPVTDVSEQILPVSLKESTALSRIDFVFPEDTALNAIQETQENTLHLGQFVVSPGLLGYRLFSETKSNHLEEECDEEENCKSFFRGFHVAPEHHVFENGDEISLNNQSFQVKNVSLQAEGWRIEVSPDNLPIDPMVPSPVELQTNFSGQHQFWFDMSSVDFKPGYNAIQVRAYDENNQVVNDEMQDRLILRVGDGRLGGLEDQVEVLSSNLPYPTGLAWSGNSLSVSEEAQYITSFIEFDYQSDFEVDDLNFESKNNGTLLEMSFTTVKSIDEQENKTYQTHTLSAALDEI